MPEDSFWSLIREEDEKIFRYPSKTYEKRPVLVRINSWVGTSAIGASHYYVDIQEGENYLWCESKNQATCWNCQTVFEFAREEANVICQREGDYLEICCPLCKKVLSVDVRSLHS